MIVRPATLILLLALLAGCGQQTPPYHLSQVPGAVTIAADRPLSVEVDGGSLRLAPGERLAIAAIDGALVLHSGRERRALAAAGDWGLELEAEVRAGGRELAFFPRPLPPERRGDAPLVLRIRVTD